ncbi:uncharacterized protein SCHCODRAFT_02518600 [Schizophyllum commune H4-8]|uniref:uncharacterized protein n=1 Tax=Schizophyllum commune (strain H4-8 / FGSC 9210) TaxID=578458 RepID=UPI00215F3850|nr:uncharacterized protein SCHCODRAFT_02518600 [Schizophyllum commune H4-8]KAI5886051.1 hypothetical protein SCHCODRAFT_02518600 [Schizophyllum commune H4-8]
MDSRTSLTTSEKIWLQRNVPADQRRNREAKSAVAHLLPLRDEEIRVSSKQLEKAVKAYWRSMEDPDGSTANRHGAINGSTKKPSHGNGRSSGGVDEEQEPEEDGGDGPDGTKQRGERKGKTKGKGKAKAKAKTKGKGKGKGKGKVDEGGNMEEEQEEQEEGEMARAKAKAKAKAKGKAKGKEKAKEKEKEEADSGGQGEDDRDKTEAVEDEDDEDDEVLHGPAKPSYHTHVTWCAVSRHSRPEVWDRVRRRLARETPGTPFQIEQKVNKEIRHEFTEDEVEAFKARARAINIGQPAKQDRTWFRKSHCRQTIARFLNWAMEVGGVAVVGVAAWVDEESGELEMVNVGPNVKNGPLFAEKEKNWLARGQLSDRVKGWAAEIFGLEDGDDGIAAMGDQIEGGSLPSWAQVKRRPRHYPRLLADPPDSANTKLLRNVIRQYIAHAMSFHNQSKATRWSHLREELDPSAFPEPAPERGSDPYAMDPSSMKKEPMLKFIRHWLQAQEGGSMPVKPFVRKASGATARTSGSRTQARRKTKAPSDGSGSSSEEEPAEETSDEEEEEEDEDEDEEEGPVIGQRTRRSNTTAKSRSAGPNRHQPQSTASLLLENDMSIGQRAKALIKRAKETSNRVAALVAVYMVQVCLEHPNDDGIPETSLDFRFQDIFLITNLGDVLQVSVFTSGKAQQYVDWVVKAKPHLLGTRPQKWARKVIVMAIATGLLHLAIDSQGYAEVEPDDEHSPYYPGVGWEIKDHEKLIAGILRALHTGPDKDSLSPCPKTTAALAKDRPGVRIEDYVDSHASAREHAAVAAMRQRAGVHAGGASGSTLASKRKAATDSQPSKASKRPRNVQDVDDSPDVQMEEQEVSIPPRKLRSETKRDDSVAQQGVRTLRKRTPTAKAAAMQLKRSKKSKGP